MGEHDQTVLHDEDAHASIHDDGRTLDHPEFAPGAGAGAEDDVYNDTPLYRDSHGKLIPDTVHVRLRAFSVTQWESQYSTVFAPVGFRLFEPSFAPVVDDSWRVVGHLGWIDGYDICVPYDTVRTGSRFWYILQERRLGEWRQRLLDEADRFDRRPLPFPVHPVHAPVPPGRFSTLWDDARRGPLKEKSIEEIYQNNLNYFLRGGGKAFVGGGSLDSDYAPYVDLPPPGLPDEGVWGRPNKPFSSGYEFQVLVNPDGYLQAVLGVRKVPPKMYGERVLGIAFEVIDIALTILMIIDIVTIPVVLFRLGVVVAREAAIRAVEVAIDREAKAALKLVEQEAKRVLNPGAMSGPEQAEAKTAWEKLKKDFWDAGETRPQKILRMSKDEVEKWNRKIADRMRELGIPENNIGVRKRTYDPASGGLLSDKRIIKSENGQALNTLGRTRGGNLRSFASADEVEELGISVHGNVFDDWKGFDLWNQSLHDDRIDAIIAHEWSEFNELSHWETVELVPETKLPIRQKARELLREMAKWGNSEKAFTEFTKKDWKAIQAARKATAHFDEKMAAAAAAKAKQ